MSRFTVRDPGFRQRVHDSFERQQVMAHLGAVLTRVDPGEVEIALPYSPELTQQHGYLHAGIVATILDSACGYAAYTLMPADADVLTVEYKINLLAPAAGDTFVARARVLRPGRTLTVCSGEVTVRRADESKVVAAMQATIMALPGGTAPSPSSPPGADGVPEL